MRFVLDTVFLKQIHPPHVSARGLATSIFEDTRIAVLKQALELKYFRPTKQKQKTIAKIEFLEAERGG